jgi:hypothetical protein
VTKIKHLLVVAGPAGAGKSTFMRELTEGRLDRAILEALPAGAASWPRATANDIDARGVGASFGDTTGFVVHYNTMRPYSKGFAGYALDPALQAVVSIGAPMTIATVVPKPAVLLQQYRARIAEQNEEEWWVTIPRMKAFRRKIRALIRERAGRPAEPVKPEQLRLMNLYETPGAIDQWSKRWQAYLEGLRQERRDMRLLFIAPHSVVKGHPGFSWATCPQRGPV